MAVGVKYEFPAELIERVAERTAELLSQQTQADDAWLDVGEAADYLRCPTSRIYALTSARKIPHHHDGARLLFRRSVAVPDDPKDPSPADGAAAPLRRPHRQNGM
jgi:excisionase family DNA binding protein